MSHYRLRLVPVPRVPIEEIERRVTIWKWKRRLKAVLPWLLIVVTTAGAAFVGMK